MSLVMSLVTKNVAIISGDLRAVNVDEPSEKLHGVTKVFQVNDKVVYGLTGDLNAMNDIRGHLAEQATDKANVQAIARILRRYLVGRLKETPDMQIRAHVIGIGDGGKITMIELYYDDSYALHKIVPSDSEAKWAMMYPEINPEEHIAEHFAKLSEYTSESLSEMLQAVNSEVAQLDDFVSSECDVITIER